MQREKDKDLKKKRDGDARGCELVTAPVTGVELETGKYKIAMLRP